jgi:hypothetical protein
VPKPMSPSRDTLAVVYACMYVGVQKIASFLCNSCCRQQADVCV